ncbi:sugar ABC transporter permease [Streptomyces sp. 110]|uniref:Sugar ABC transporter permease n=1 Tax=Streptomyces endocoffeicus TaxID=2898945 RepID=A0ABS1Q0M3_9ACTN|nr:sugar ABC transporter permease [Streptomyces endocoffeicus]MBL1118208.1 sugar ABC transporter permease [Streptomyces endocoffeicus]
MNRNPAPVLDAAPATKRPAAGRAPAASGQARYVPWLYILPVLILVVGIVYVGIGYTGWISTRDWNGIDPVSEPAGLSNYARIATDPAFWQTIAHFVVFAVLTILIQMALGLFMAVLLSGNAVFARPLYKIVLFVPVVLAPAVVATAFRSILSPQGSLNALLSSIGLPASDTAWLADPQLALYALAAVNIWQWTGLSFLLYQAAISQLDQNLFEAAALDGASGWQTFRLVLVPQLRGTHATLALTGCIGALKTFDLVYLTTGGGPGRGTEFVTTYIYEQVIDQFHAGYSAALSIVLVILALLLSMVQIRAYRFGEE